MGDDDEKVKIKYTPKPVPDENTGEEPPQTEGTGDK